MKTNLIEHLAATRESYKERTGRYQGADGRGDICRQVSGPNPLQSRRFHGTNGATRRRT